MTYYQTIYTTIKCPTCNGEGTTWEKEYHNQIVKETCYKCKGKGTTHGPQTIKIEVQISPIILTHTPPANMPGH